MKKPVYLFLFLFLIGISPLKAQTSEESRTLTPFNAIKVSHAIEAEMVKGSSHEVVITASGIALENVETKVNNRTLEVRIVKSSSKSAVVKVKITYVDLEEVNASTSAKVFVRDNMEAKNIKISASTSSYIEASLNSQNLLLEAETNAKIFVSGKSKDLELKGFTNAEINGKDLQVENATVRVNTASNARFQVNGSLKGSAATAGKVYYSGNPKIIDVKTSIGGEIEEEQ